MKGFVGLVVLLVAIVGVSGTPAEATIVDFASADASVEFNIGTSSMTIKLTNTGTVAALGDVLTGVVFTFSATPPAETLTGASAAGTASCTGSGNSTTCSTNSTAVSASGSSPFGWTLSTSAATDSLLAGAGSFKPNGIVNGTIVSGKDGLGESGHNPFLLGPATFTKNFTTSAPANLTVTAVTFDFGTGPDKTETGLLTPVPEPGTMFLGGTGLILFGYAARRRFLRRSAG
jgi:hypothetical protein